MSETPPAPQTSSRWEDLLDIFISPVELFRRRADGRFGHALLALLILSALIYFGTRSAMQPLYEAEFAHRMAGRPNMSPEALETSRKVGLSLAPIIVLIGIPIGVFVLGAVIWLATRVVGGRVSYAQGAAIATFAFFPRVVEGISAGVQALLMDESRLTSLSRVSLGVARFLDPDKTSVILLSVLSRIDLFILWGTALVAIGIRQMAGTSTGQAVLGAGLVWLVGTLPALVQALLAA